MHEVLVNRFGGLSLPRKSVVRLTDRPDMTLDVYRGRKTTMQQTKHVSELDKFLCTTVNYLNDACVKIHCITGIQNNNANPDDPSVTWTHILMSASPEHSVCVKIHCITGIQNHNANPEDPSVTWTHILMSANFPLHYITGAFRCVWLRACPKSHLDTGST